MDITLHIITANPTGIDHIANTMTGPAFSQEHDSHPEGEDVVFSGLPGFGTYTLTSQAYADRDDHEVGDPSTLTIAITGPAPTPVTIS
jgi:hypothetical protein